MAVFLLLLAGAYFTRDQWMELIPGLSEDADKAPKGTGANTGSTTTPTPTTTAPSVSNTTTLQRGSSNQQVETLQKLINQVLKAKFPTESAIGVDGIFGNETETALKKLTGKTSTSVKAFEELFKGVLTGQETQGPYYPPGFGSPYLGGSWHPGLKN